MRILNYYPPALMGEYGTAEAVRGLCQALTRLGQHVTLAVSEVAAQVPPPLDVEIVEVPHILRGRLSIPRGLGSLASEHDVLIVNGGWVLNNIVAGKSAARRGVPFIVSSHGVYNPLVLQRRVLLKRVWRVLLEKKHLDSSSGVHVFFNDEREHLRALGTTTPPLIAPNGITPRQDIRWNGGGDYILWLGRFDVQGKGLDLALSALALIPQDTRPKLRLYGRDWKEGKRLVEQMVAHLGLRDWVTIEDPIFGDEKWATLRDAAAFIYPSRWEACPMAVLEAAAIGVPTLVGPYPLGRFLAERGVAEISQGRPEEIKAGIERLLGSTKRSGDHSIRVIKDEFSWPVVAESWLRQVGSLLN